MDSTHAQTLSLADGRVLGFATYGDPYGRPLLYLHGAGSSRLEPAYADAYARRNGIRVISVDRPGYGCSSPWERTSFESVGRDLQALTESLQLDAFGVAGMSAGAPYALQLAAMDPTRVRLVALINGSPDTSRPEWACATRFARWAIRFSSTPLLLRYAANKLKADPRKAATRIARRESWSPTELTQFQAMIDEGMRQPGSVQTLIAEAGRVLQRSWGLDWSTLRCPVLAVCGLRDQSRPFYQAMSRQHRQMSVVDIPGPHMPIVSGTAWDRIGDAMRVVL